MASDEPITDMCLVFKVDDCCHALKEALFLAGMESENHKNVRRTAVLFLFFSFLAVWLRG